MMPESSPLGKYRLCPNSTVKFAFFVGIALQVATLCLGIAMLSLGGWVTVTKSAASVASDRFSLTRVEGLLQDCYPGTKPAIFEPQTSSSCYTKDFGQYATSDSSAFQIKITTAGAALVSLGLLTCLLDLIIGLHLAFIWCRAPYDSFFMRTYRLFVGFCSAVTSCLFIATLVVFHVGLRLSIQRGPWNTLEHTSIDLNNGYYVAWACVATSVLAAWATVSSTCFWAMDYVNCRSVAAAFHPTCSHRASALSMTNGIRSSIYSLNTDGVWSIQDPPTLPRYYTSTFGDGSDIRNKAVDASTGENEGSKKRTEK